jgi:NTP pyrophosphatase (non-canonical NTP hydrolase)
MSEFKQLTGKLIEFRDARSWAQFHNAKDLALAISIEAAELNELFLWKNEQEIAHIDRTKVEEELADIFAFALLLAEKYNFNIPEMVLKKIETNSKKYPVEKAKGTAKKYNDL